MQMGGLLSAFKKQTGQDYNGDEQQTNMLSSLAHQVRCNPAPLLCSGITFLWHQTSTVACVLFQSVH
jgi:hypothetical protein